MFGLQVMVVEARTVAVVMVTQTAFIRSQSAQQQNMAHHRGILNTVHPLWQPPLAVEILT